MIFVLSFILRYGSLIVLQMLYILNTSAFNLGRFVNAPTPAAYHGIL